MSSISLFLEFLSRIYIRSSLQFMFYLTITSMVYFEKYSIFIPGTPYPLQNYLGTVRATGSQNPLKRRATFSKFRVAKRTHVFLSFLLLFFCTNSTQKRVLSNSQIHQPISPLTKNPTNTN